MRLQIKRISMEKESDKGAPLKASFALSGDFDNPVQPINSVS